MHQDLYVRCKIERGGFTSERTFEIDVDGQKYIGTAYYAHFCYENYQPLEEDEPAPGEVIDGWVRCRRIRNEGDRVLIEVPNAELIRVGASELTAATC